MKTKLTCSDLLFISNLLEHQLRIANYPKEYKKECIRLMNIISDTLDKIKIEIKEPKNEHKN